MDVLHTRASCDNCTEDQRKRKEEYTYMSVQCPVINFELVNEDLHRTADLIHLQQQLGFFFLIGTCSNGEDVCVNEAVKRLVNLQYKC